MKIHPALKESLGYEKDISDKEFLRHWKKRSTAVCKPCWELKYCPYGPFVEQSPLLPVTRIEEMEYYKRIQKYLESGIVGEEQPLDDATRSHYTEVIKIAKKNPAVLAAKVAHDFYLQKLSTEGEERSLEEIFSPPLSDLHKYKLPLPLFKEPSHPIDRFRRDNYTCQECGKHLKDDEVEFDHIIPVSRGGSSDEHNVSLTCYNCNRDKLARVDL